MSSQNLIWEKDQTIFCCDAWRDAGVVQIYCTQTVSWKQVGEEMAHKPSLAAWRNPLGTHTLSQNILQHYILKDIKEMHQTHFCQLDRTLLGQIHCPRIYRNIAKHIEMHQNPFWQLGGTLSWDTYLVPKFITLHSSVGICIGIWWVLLKGGFISALPSFNLTTRLALMVSIYNVQWLVLAGAQCHKITF